MIKNKSYSRGHALRIAVGTTLAILLLCGSAAADALSKSGGGSWLYYKDITIINIGDPLTDYQVLVNLTGNDFPTNASDSGADIRFTNESGNELSYWIENWNYSGRTARIWVKMPSIPIVPSSLRMHYGNPSALSSSNGDTTFDFFDDFNSISGAWTCGVTSNQYGYGSCSASNSVATVVGGTNTWWSLFAGGADSLSPPLSVEFFSKDMVVYPGGYQIGMTSSQSVVSNTYGVLVGYGGGAAFSSWNKGSVSKEGSGVNLNSMSVVRIDVYNGEIDFYINGSLVHTKTTNVPTGGMKVIMTAAQPSSSVSTDWVRVRKYASVEPSVTVGAEIQIPILKNITVSPSSVFVVVGNTQTFTATPKNQFNNPINATVTWSSSNTSVGTIDPDTGVFTGNAAGTTIVTATNGSVSGSASVTVTHKFRFVQLTDVHIGPDLESCGKGALLGLKFGAVGALAGGTGACSVSYAESIIRFISVRNDIIKSNKPNFVLITGDIVEWNTITQYPAFKDLISKFNESNIKVYVVPGNHDRRGQDFPIPNPFFPSDDLANYKNYIGDRNKYDVRDNYFNQDTYRFIGLDSGSDIGLAKSIEEKDKEQLFNFLMYPNGSGLSNKDQNDQIEFLNKTIIGDKTIIFMHHPAIDDSCKNNSCNVIFENRDLFVRLAMEKHTKLVLTGHTHEEKFFNADGDKISVSGRDTVRPMFIQTRSPTKEFPLGYLSVDVDEKGEHIKEKLITNLLPDYIIAYLESPADQHVYDEFGRHTGINTTGGVENNIPDSYYFESVKIGNITIPAFVLLYNATLNYSFEIVSNFSKENIIEPQSSFNFTIMRKGIDATSTISYNDVSINRDSRAYLQINTSQTNYAMHIDMNNDGAIDITKQPDTVKTDEAPIAIILSPTDGSFWDQGQPITLNGTGIDREDGTLTKLTWISDIDGIIGHGNFTASDLSAGVHNITLLVNDSIGQINTSKITLTVRDTKPPSLNIDFPPENKIFNRQNIAVRGIAYDDSGISSVTINGIQAGKENWNTVLGLNEGKNTIEIVATDNKGFSVTSYRTVYYNSSLVGDTNPPAAITNLTHRTGHDSANRAWINWTWDNPKDEDFSYAIIHLENIRMENTSRSYFNISGLSDDAEYTINILSADIVDNINYTEVKDGVRTPPPDTTPPTTDVTLSGIPGDGDWYLSNVEMSLKAADDEFGTGVAKVEYSLADTNWVTYSVPFTINTEGITTVYYRSTDNAGNIESSRNKTIKIDKTPPETAIRFDTTSRDIKVYNNETGSEVNYTGLPFKKNKDSKEDDEDEKGWELRQYVLADKAGNSLVLVLKHKKEGKEVKVEVLSTQYNDQTAINAVENKMQAEYSEDKNGLLKELEQAIEAKKRFEAGAKYSAKKDESEIKVKLDGQKEQKETKSGIAILGLLTEKGGLKLRY